VTVALASACSSSNGGGAGGGGSTAPVKVGLVYSQTGLLASYGKEYRQGFDAGLQYATNGTGSAGGHKIEIIPRDDAGDSAKGVSATKDLIGQGVKMIAGTVDSGIATQLAPLAAQNQVLYISGPAATDAITGINKYTFRSGRESYQDVKTAAAVVGDVSGKSVLVFAQDYEFGQANAKAVQQVLGGAGAKVSSLLVPLSAKDFTPFAQQIKQKKPDLLFVAWAGDTTSAMWTALDQQGIFGIAKVITGLADSASFNAYGSATTKIQFLAHYFPGAADNPVNTKMISLVKQAGGTPDLFTPDGFVAAQMVVHAVKTANGDSVDKMISALDGWTFQAPKGEQTVRAGDHAMVQPMFIATLQKSGSSFEPKLVKSVPVNDVAPPSGS
jgi:branched-chain amino acid transport system substrate-binding protein